MTSPSLVTSQLPPAILTYAITPNAVAYTDPQAKEPSTVTLMVAVLNGTTQAVPVDRIVLTLATGAATDRAALTSNPASITAGRSLGTTWNIQADGTGNFTIT